MTVQIWGVKFDPMTKTELVERVQAILATGRLGVHLTGVNAETVVAAQKIPELRAAINDSDFVNVDSVLTVWGLRFNGIAVPERAATPDVFELFLAEADRRRQSVYFLGAKREILERAVAAVRERYPNLIVAGFRDGYYRDEAEVVAEIKRAAPTYLFVALATPQKETFVQKYKNELNAGVLYGIGGAIDVWGGKISRGPRWGRKFGLECLSRMIQSPANFGVRNFKAYPRFLAIVLRRFFAGERPDDPPSR